jgi:hypothetical protein
MIEANEDISLTVERQLNDVEQGQAQARAIAEGREVHPAILAAQAEADYAPPPPVEATVVAAHTVQRPAGPPPDPDAAMRHLRLSIAAVVVLALFLLWLRQRRMKT